MSRRQGPPDAAPDPANHGDVVEVALGRADAQTRERVAADVSRRERLVAVRAHLARYDGLPPPPPPPPWARVAEALGRDRTARRRLWGAALAIPAAAALAAFLLLGPLRGPAAQPAGAAGTGVVAWEVPEPTASTSGSGDGRTPGLARSRAGAALPPGRADVGDRLSADATTEVRFASGRVLAVLEAGAVLDLLGARHTAISSGRVWFEVTPALEGQEAFRVTTRWGDVVVKGTSFEVDARGADLGVAVLSGRVEVAGQPVQAGTRWDGGTITPVESAPGGFARVPGLTLEVEGAPVAGRPVVLRFGFENRRSVPLRVAGREGAPAALWLSLRGPDGTPYDLPVPPDDWLPDGADGFTLAPGERRVLPVRFLRPFASPGPYRGAALYRPPGLPAVRSGTVGWEVR